ncbi:cysteine hydrolase family protein [Bordetella sp. BOR01]|uniref:cysteine hydrolase family protein n=1 Tax=Bordetella sp. BOR01 TaxID=2854779 RepID=UPI002101E2D9|nr:isochorismatase family cysteine hydrolase [Bordetella sp. BOR01]
MNSIYLVLDMQNDLVNPEDASRSNPLAEQARGRGIVERTARAIGAARNAGVAVGFVRVGFSSNYHECPAGSPLFSGAPRAGLFKLGSRGAELHPDLDARETDIHVIKHRVSPFYATTLMAQLSALRVQRIYCSGVSTQAVVQAAVRDAHDRDFDVVLFEDCCAAHSAEEHANSIQSLARFCRVARFDDTGFGAAP